MKHLIFVFSLLLITPLAKLADAPADTKEEVDDGNVIVLTDETFDQAINENEFILVEFYAPWCGHCKNLAPEYAKASITLADTNIKLAKVDATAQPISASRHRVRGYPTLFFFDHGKKIDYNGGRDEKGIVDWVTKRSKMQSKELQTISDIKAFAKESFNTYDYALILIGNKGYDSYLSKVKQLDKEVAFGHCFTEDCMKGLKVEKSGTLALVRKFTKSLAFLRTPDFGLNELKKFLDREGTPTVIEYEEKYDNLLFTRSIPGLFICVEKITDELRSIAEAVAKANYRQELQVVLSTIEKNTDKKLLDHLNIKKEQRPIVKLADARIKLKIYRFTGEITQQNLQKFIDNWNSNKIEAEIKSEDIPTTQGPVIKVVGKTFKSIVKDPTKDVLVKIYAPWCGHCKAIAPIYEDLAKAVSNNPNLIIADVDATANDMDGMTVGSYPTIHLYSAKNKSPLAFKGERTVKDMIEFLKENCSLPFEVQNKEDL
jgi:protein disulfide-isomerase A1